jgi:3-deoxy-D-manno-octulosonate 8-phosphate phosphatase (KDO 8-P phosphatase)
MLNYKEKLHQITTFVFDVDGVLTNGTVHITDDGLLLRTMNIKDGYALKAAIDLGYKVCIISGGSNDGVRIRFQKLGITAIYLGVPDKVKVLENYCKEQNISMENILYMGDDLPDYHVMQMVGLPTCPQDAIPEIKKLSSYISHKKGGKGAVRDVIEQVLKVQDNWMKLYNGSNN